VDDAAAATRSLHDQAAKDVVRLFRLAETVRTATAWPRAGLAVQARLKPAAACIRLFV
jgi:hypothetical protein